MPVYSKGILSAYYRCLSRCPIHSSSLIVLLWIVHKFGVCCQIRWAFTISSARKLELICFLLFRPLKHHRLIQRRQISVHQPQILATLLLRPLARARAHTKNPSPSPPMCATATMTKSTWLLFVHGQRKRNMLHPGRTAHFQI